MNPSSIIHSSSTLPLPLSLPLPTLQRPHNLAQNLLEPLIPPPQQQHILRPHRAPPRMLREALQVDARVHDLRPDQLGQAADELRRGLHAQLDRLFVDQAADAVPERGFQGLFFCTGENEFDRLLGCERKGEGFGRGSLVRTTEARTSCSFCPSGSVGEVAMLVWFWVGCTCCGLQVLLFRVWVESVDLRTRETRRTRR